MPKPSPLREIMEKEITNCSIHDGCERVVPLWLVLLDNIPTAAMFLLGASLLWMVWIPLAILMMIYNLAAVYLFWALICRHCQHLGTRACPCGYGIVAARYFRKKEGSNFRSVFRKNIAIMYPCWFIPLAAGIYLLFTRFSTGIFLIFGAFVLFAFVLIPVISRFVGCKGCNLKSQCPWMISESASASTSPPV